MLPLFLALSWCVAATVSQESYRIPTPVFSAYKPRGLRLGVPHAPGMDLVVFHVNVNKRVDDQEGDYTKYVVRPIGDSWVYTNDVLRLKIGDKVHVRLLVLKDGQQYAEVLDPFVVTVLQKISDKPILASPPTSTTKLPLREPSTTPSPEVAHQRPLGNCEAILQNVTQVILDLEEQLGESQDDVAVLKDLLPGPYFVKISGTITQTYEDPYKVVDVALKNKLQMKKISYKTCVRTGEYIVCELSSVDDKVELIKCVKKCRVQPSIVRVIY